MAIEDKPIPVDLEPDERILGAVRDRLEGGRLSCKAAMDAAEELGCQPIEVGCTADIARLRLTRCQLGLFGFPGHAKGWAAAGVERLPAPAELEDLLVEARDTRGFVTCLELWRHADRLAVARIHAGHVAERLGVRVRSCQLGAF